MSETAVNKGGRPTLYTPELGDAICAGIASAKSLDSICKEEGMPGSRTVYTWRRENDEFQQNYARAREDQGDKLAEDVLEICDQAEPETVQVDKLRVDTRKWLASKFNRAYSDKTITEIDINDSFADRIMRGRERGSNTEES